MTAFNLAVVNREVHNSSGELITDQQQALLIEQQQNIAFLITGGIPQLLPQLAISLAGLVDGKSFE